MASIDLTEAQIKLLLNDVSVRNGLKENVSQFDSWKDQVMEKIHPIHHAFRELRMVAHAFGAIAVVTAFSEIIDYAEKLKGVLDGDKDAFEKMIDSANKKLAELNEGLVQTRRKLEDLREHRQILTDDEKEENQAARLRELERDKIYAEGSLLDKQRDKEAADAMLNKSSSSDPYQTQYESTAKDAAVAVGEAQAKYDKASVELEEYKNKLFDERRQAQKEMDEETSKEADEDAREEKERNDQLHRLKMFHLEEEKVKRDSINKIQEIKNAENAAFQPSADQILKSGWWYKGRFHRSWASIEEEQIQKQTQGIQMDVANFGMSDDIRRRMENVNSMKSDLNKFLGVTGTPQERIAKATEESKEHLKDIRAAFYNEQ